MEDEAISLIKAAHLSGGSLITPVGEFKKADLAEALQPLRKWPDKDGEDDHGRAKGGEGTPKLVASSSGSSKYGGSGVFHETKASALREAEAKVKETGKPQQLNMARNESGELGFYVGPQDYAESEVAALPKEAKQLKLVPKKD